MKRVAIAALAAAVLAGSALAATVNPKTIVLRRSDLRPGFRVATPFHYVKASAASNSWGFVTGYGGVFRDEAAASHKRKGAFEIDSYASVYRTAKGAGKSLAAARAFCAHAPRKPLHLGVRLGDESAFCLLRAASGRVDDFVLAWRSGRVRADIVVSAWAGVVHVKNVRQLALVQAHRIS